MSWRSVTTCNQEGSMYVVAYNIMLGLLNRTTRKPIEINLRIDSEARTLAPRLCGYIGNIT
ncbi:MAG: hypothetical protein NWE95_09090 [Candidatus Bathyarchaeota archaeon]|nr:hypothetical protein [Candidatus Bathyarchaeota archaeon]